MKVDAQAAPEVSFAEAKAAPWNVVLAAPATAPAKKLIAPNIAVRPNQVVTDPRAQRIEDEPTALLFTSREANSVVVEHVATDHSDKGGPFHRSRAWIERYDLGTGATQAEVQTSGLMQIMDASPSGNTIVFHTGTDVDRVDVMSFDKRAYKPLIAFRPYDSEPVDPKVTADWRKNNNRVEAATLMMTRICSRSARRAS